MPPNEPTAALPPQLPALDISESKVSWPLQFSGSVQAKRIALNSLGQAGRILSCPWWLNAVVKEQHLILTPRNCGFYSGQVTIEADGLRARVPVAASILPSLMRAFAGLGTGGLAALFPIAVAALLLLLAAPFLIFVPYYGYGFLPLLIVTGILLLGAMPLMLGRVWGLFLRSGRAWFGSIVGIFLGGVLAFLTYIFVHANFGVTSPEPWRVFFEVSVISLAWVGSVAICAGGSFRMLFPAAAVVLLGAGLVVNGLGDFATKAFTKPPPLAPLPAHLKGKPSDVIAPGTFELLRSGQSFVRNLGLAAHAALCIQLVFCGSLPLLLIFMIPIPKPTRQIGGKTYSD